MKMRKLFELSKKSENKSGFHTEEEELLFTIISESSIGTNIKQFYKTEDGKYIGIFKSLGNDGVSETLVVKYEEEQIKDGLRLFNHKKYVELFGESEG